MLLIHAAQKLLNNSRLTAPLYISTPGSGQQMHSWYARLLSSGFPGKLFVLYVHQPSLLTIVCRGKTIKGTWPEFQQRLPALLQRFHFPAPLIDTEIKEATEYLVSKTNSKSMLAHMNQMVYQLEYHCTRFSSYDSIEQDLLEDRMMDYLYDSGIKQKPYITPLGYWQAVF